MVTELLLLALTIVAAGVVIRPLRTRVRRPQWLERARQQGRPGIPVTAWVGATLLMSLAWLIGERRGLVGVALLLVWIGAPLAALGITLSWRKDQTMKGPRTED